MSREEKYELFEAYLDNSLTEEDKIAFDKLMLDDACQRELEEYKNIKQAYTHIAAKEEKEKELLATLQAARLQHNTINSTEEKETQEDHIDTQEHKRYIQQDAKKINPFSFSRNIKLGLAAGVAILIGLFFYDSFFGQKESMQSLYASNYTVENLSLERGTANDSLETITTLYNSKKYSQALPLLKTYSATHPENGNLKIALATCYFNANDYTNTEKVLQQLIAQNDAYTEKAQWYLAMCYLKQEKKSEAVALLSSFGKEHFYFEKGQNILKQLK